MFLVYFFAVLALIWFLGNYNIWRLPKSELAPRILMYHSIDNIPASGMNITPKKIDKQLSYLSKKGYNFVKISQLKDYSGQKKVIAITLDDGFANNYHKLYPILKKYNAPVTIYLSPEAVGYAKMTSDQILTMHNDQYAEFGAHTMTHINLKNSDDETAFTEIKRSKEYVEEITGEKCKSFAYPYGRYETKHIEMLKKLGFDTAVTTKKQILPFHKINKYRIPRISINGKMNMLQFYIAISRGRYKL